MPFSRWQLKDVHYGECLAWSLLVWSAIHICLHTYIHTLFKPIRVYIVHEYKNSRIHSDAMAERRALKPLTRSQIKSIQIIIQI